MENIKDLLVDTLEDLLKDELIRFQWYLINGVEDFKKIRKAQLENADRRGTVDKMVEIHLEGGAVEITLAILKKINQNQLAQELLIKYRKGLTVSSTAQPGACSISASALYEDVQKKAQCEQLKSHIKSQYKELYEGTAGKGEHSSLHDIYTDLYVVKDWNKKVNTDHEVVRMEAEASRYTTADTPVKFSEIFSGKCGSKKVLTLGIAGIGKTVSVQKFALDWAEGKSSADIDFVFIIPFRELNLLKEEQHSLHDLLLYLYPDLKKLKETGLFDGKCKSLFIFDGLDEFRKPLDFKQKKMLNITQKVCVDVLVTNLIRGALLPSAHVWITSRPAAADQIPLDTVRIHLVTEVRGFTDQQKEEYFRKRISDESQANKIISHIKQSKTLYIMCYIPVLCWIMFTVLQEMMKKAEIPKTLTQMYTYFLTIQINTNNQKQNKPPQKDRKKLLESHKKLILKLAELAFTQLMNNNVLFEEEDLIRSGIDVTESVKFGIFTEIFKEESVFYQKKVYCFVHLSFQEFLAAVYVFYCYENKNMNKLQVFRPEEKVWWSMNVPLDELLTAAVDKAVDSKTGHLDLFLRFLLGISLESNQRLLQGLLTQTNKSSEKTTEHIKELIKRGYNHIKNERSINLFLCLSEMNDQSLSREIQEYLKSDKLSETYLFPGQCSALAYMLLTSEEVLDELDLKKYRTMDLGYIRLIPAVSVCKKAWLNGFITEDSCKTISSALQSVNSPLRDLDLSNNDLKVSGVELISAGLKSPHCNLEILRLAGCNITPVSCGELASCLSVKSSLRELDLSNNDLQDSGVELISAGLKKSPHCNLQTLNLTFCNLGEKACKILGSALQCVHFCLKELDLSNNDLRDSGVRLFSAGLKSLHCKLNILRLSGCMVTQEGCSSLASALKLNPYHLRELDLTYNHPGEAGVKELSDLLKHPQYKLRKLQLEHGGQIRITPGLRKYFCKLTLDPNTAQRHHDLYEKNRVMELTSCTLYPEPYYYYKHVLSKEPVSGRSYWEVEWEYSGIDADVTISASYKEIINREQENWYNPHSWNLRSSYGSSFSFCHKYFRSNDIAPLSPRVGVYVDQSAGTLSFYSISDTVTHIYTVQTTFTQPLYAGFCVSGGTVKLCG